MKKILLVLLLGFDAYATTFTVINTNNSGTGSLLQAILDANSASGNCTINFNIPGVAPQIIAPTAFYSTLPNRVYPAFVNNNIILDATTQSGFALGSPSVIIDANALSGGGRCLSIVGASNCIIKGIGIERFVNGGSGRGISIESTITTSADSNQILQCKLGSFNGNFGNTRAIVMDGQAGGFVSNTLIDSNVLSGNSIAGIQGQFNVINSLIQNNYIGCNYGGTIAIGNAYGVVILSNGGPDATNNIIQNNVISGNLTFGVVIQGATQNIARNNIIGLDASQTVLLGSTLVGVLLNGVGTYASSNNTIHNNVICGCGNGVYINDNSINQIVTNNLIGTNAVGANLGNGGSGILIQGNGSGPCVGNLIESNIIRYNGFTVAGDNFGVNIGDPSVVALIAPLLGENLVDTSMNGHRETHEENLRNRPSNRAHQYRDPSNPDILNAILENNIYGNNLNGISLTNNGNDNQIPPTINTANICSSDTNIITISVTAPATPPASNFRLEFFINTINRNPVTEGASYIGAIPSVVSGQTVTTVFTVTSPAVVPGNFVSATATNLNNSGNPGDTSEFSLNTTVGTAAGPTITNFTAVPNPICSGLFSALTVFFTPGTSPTINALWSDGLFQTNVTSPLVRFVSPLVTTTYSVTITDGVGCAALSPVLTLTVSKPFVTLTTPTPIVAAGTAAVLIATPTGNAPFVLDWSDGVVETNIFGPVARIVYPTVTTVYNVTVTDVNGCSYDPPMGVTITVGMVGPLELAILEKYCRFV